MKTSEVGNEFMSVIEVTGVLQNPEAQMIQASLGWYVHSNQKGKYAKSETHT